jgi:hypothetical protein
MITTSQVASSCWSSVTEPPAPELRRAIAVDPLVIVNIVGFATPLSVSMVGLNDANPPDGSPETLNEMGFVNPFAVGVAVI